MATSAIFTDPSGQRIEAFLSESWAVNVAKVAETFGLGNENTETLFEFRYQEMIHSVTL